MSLLSRISIFVGQLHTNTTATFEHLYLSINTHTSARINDTYVNEIKNTDLNLFIWKRRCLFLYHQIVIHILPLFTKKIYVTYTKTCQNWNKLNLLKLQKSHQALVLLIFASLFLRLHGMHNFDWPVTSKLRLVAKHL